MEKWSAVAQVVAPIFAAVLIGVWARRKELLTHREVKGMQQYVMNFGLPCVLFNSCLSATMNAASVVSFVMVFTTILSSVLFAFFVLRKKMPYHNLPMMFAAQVRSLISMDFMTHSSRIRLASSNTRFIRRSGTIHGAIATTSSGQAA